MKLTFTEKFGKIYAYPYGSSFQEKATKALEDDEDKHFMQHMENELLFEDQYERILLAKHGMRPFHLDCPVTKKHICRCAHSNTPLEELDKVLHRGQKRQRTTPAVLPQALAYDMHLYYEGYPANMLDKLTRKLAHEKERMMQVADKSYVNSFCKFIESEDEEQLSQKGPMYDVRTTTQQCAYCKTQIFESNKGQPWRVSEMPHNFELIDGTKPQIG